MEVIPRDAAAAAAARAYLSEHPEIDTMLVDFVHKMLKATPDDPVQFAKTYFASLPESGHRPLVFVGPSGVGKGTLIKRLMDHYGPRLGFSVSHTTRPPRPGEEHGKHYHFSRRDSMEARINKGEFIEHANVHGNLYGTSYHGVRKVREEGKICILDIDVQGLETVRKTSLGPRSIYIAPPSFEELERRLRGRGTETEESVAKRLANAKEEIARLDSPGFVDYKVVNDDLDLTFSSLVKQLEAWYPHLKSE